MRMFLLAFLALLISQPAWAQGFSEDEVTLYSARGKPVAYVADDDDATIYLWSGKPVAYLYSDSIYGFNGKHLGWFKSGIIYDHEGYRVGATEQRLGTIAQISPIKSIKEIKPIKSIREIPPIRPILSLSWSADTTLRLFLLEGRE